MLIKLQKTRFSREYMVIENARNVTYYDEPIYYSGEKTLFIAMQEFYNNATLGYRHSCWYQIENDGSGHEGYELEFQNGYAINRICFDNNKGEREEMRFDGEAFICNDEGKTIHRIKVGGCTSFYNSEKNLTSGSSITPQAA